MLSIDTNILFYALNADSPHHEAAREFLLSVQGDERVALSELVLVELYGLLRNAAASPRPLSPAQAVDVVSSFRNHPRWRLIGFPLTSRGLLGGTETKGNLACDWFDISCSDGSSDECCGSVSSCLGYCSEVCGGPCEYEN
jgi:predicted nucleic acid-binding protein